LGDFSLVGKKLQQRVQGHGAHHLQADTRLSRLTGVQKNCLKKR